MYLEICNNNKIRQQTLSANQISRYINLLVNKLLDLGAVEVAVVKCTFSHPVQAVQHYTGVESLIRKTNF